MSEYVIETNQVTKRYPSVVALDHVNIHVKKGSIYGLVGDNGAGKTTLLKLLVGHSYPTAGEIRLFDCFGEKNLERCRRQIGAMIEQPGFYPNMTVEQMLEYYRIQKGVPGKGKVEEMLELTDIKDKRKTKCKNLSLGQKQRLGLAIAMIGEPQLLILDEPINGLDPSGIIEVRNLLRKLNTEKNITILLSSHILAELQQIATMYGFLNKGKLLEEISARELQEKCSDCIEIMVSDAEAFTVLLERFFPEERYQVMPSKSIRILNPIRKPEDFSQLAAEHSISVAGLQRMKSSLEDYYVNLKTGVQANAELY